MQEILLTIITPSYNRGYTLNRLYESLCNQNMRIKWLIVDDGSTDDTSTIVKDFKSTSYLEITYVKKTNGGKHTAINYGMKYIETPLTMIVDSDDWLMPEAVKEIGAIYNKYKSIDSVGVFSFLKCYSDGRIIIEAESKEIIDNYTHYRVKGNRPGDMAEVFRTRVLKDNPFPVFEGERFLSEDIVWVSIARRYSTVFTNVPIYMCEYLEDGLSFNDKPMKLASPLGSMLRGKVLMSKECGLVSNIKGAIIYNAYKNCINTRVSKMKPDTLILSFYQKILTTLTIPMGKLYYWKITTK